MRMRCLSVLTVFVFLAGTPVLADSITFVFTFNAAGAGIAGQSGIIAVSVRSNVSSPPTTATFSNFSFPSPGVLGAVNMVSCSATGSLNTQLGLTATDTSSSGPNLPNCLLHQAVVTFPSSLSILATANYVTGLPVELELGIGNANGSFGGAAVGYVNTDGNGNTTMGFVVIPGAINLFANPNFTATQAANPVPEPGTIILLGSGLAAMGIWRRCKQIWATGERICV